jgi:next-to-BRCA1 protein 1
MLGLGGELDAQFVQDVTMFDETELAPGTEFTKIWRLRNSGSSAWPPQTQLVHVGGDDICSNTEGNWFITRDFLCALF